MSLAQPEQDARPASGLSLNLSSNNPFRNRAVSPALPSPSARPVSRNPFLDPALNGEMSTSTAQSQPSLMGHAAELFDNLTLGDRPNPITKLEVEPADKKQNDAGRPSSRSGADKPRSGPGRPPRRPENMRPRGPPPPGHRPSRSQEEAMRARKQSGPAHKPRASGDLDIFADPSDVSSRREAPRRTRRNSESSVADAKTDEEEKKRQERRRRERRERDKDAKPKRPNHKLDLIDKLDVTSIYGTGLFHHDGPFDACNPHRNRKGSKRAPMQAFPADSLNNALGGGPIPKKADHSAFMGNYIDEGFKDYSRVNNTDRYASSSRIVDGKAPNVESATTRIEPVHGDETLGLGTSTFLEGAPASRAALQRRESEAAAAAALSPGEQGGGGLSRTKSLAQKIRSIPRRDPNGRVTSPDGGAYTSPTAESSNKATERNPFFNEYGSAETRDGKEDKAGVQVSETERERKDVSFAIDSPPRRERLERRVTSDAADDAGREGRANGFLSRVKSLKGGPKRPRVPEKAQAGP